MFQDVKKSVKNTRIQIGNPGVICQSTEQSIKKAIYW